MEKPIEILGEEIDPEQMPVLYKWAKINPEGLARQLKSMSEKNKVSVASVMVMLESDTRTDND
jgi:hypothetical protein